MPDIDVGKTRGRLRGVVEPGVNVVRRRHGPGTGLGTVGRVLVLRCEFRWLRVGSRRWSVVSAGVDTGLKPSQREGR